MSARLEAAAKAMFDTRDDPYDMDEWEEIDSTEREPYTCQAAAALSAADAVMFSDAAIERAARAEYEADSCPGDPTWEELESYVRDNYHRGIRVIIASLKEGAA